MFHITGKRDGKFVSVYAMMVCGGVKAYIQLLLNLALGWSGQIHGSAPEPLRKGPHYPISRNFFLGGGFRVVVGAVEERL